MVLCSSYLQMTKQSNFGRYDEMNAHPWINMNDLSPTALILIIFIWVEQVQEKKVKKISDMNIDPSKANGNGSIASSSNSCILKPHLANGGSSDKTYSYLSSDFSFPPGGLPSLRLPSVVVFNLQPPQLNSFFQIFVYFV